MKGRGFIYCYITMPTNSNFGIQVQVARFSGLHSDYEISYVSSLWGGIIGRCKCTQCVRSLLYTHCMWPSAPWFLLLRVSLLMLFWGWRMGKMVGVGQGILHGSPSTKNKTKREPQSPAWGAKCSCPANEILKWAIMPP